MYDTQPKTCRFCKDLITSTRRGVQYGPRHHAHFDCYLDAEKKLDALRPRQVGTFPYTLLVERGLLDEARVLTYGGTKTHA